MHAGGGAGGPGFFPFFLMPAPELLLTGFEPFGGDSFNPAGARARALHGRLLGGTVGVVGLELPVSGPTAWRKLSASVRRSRPSWIVALGVSGRAEISIETTAWNEEDYGIPDNAGRQPRGQRILARGPAHLASGLAGRLGEAGGGAAGLAIRRSADPGRFVCNHLYYRLLHLTRQAGHSAHQRAIFLHLPATWEMRRSLEDRRRFYALEGLQEAVLGLLRQVVGGESGSPSPHC